MQLDRTHVAIRSRLFSELADLAIMVLRQYPQAVTVGFLLGALPWAIANLLLLGWIPWQETAEAIYDEETYTERYRYVWLMVCLVFLQTPIAGVLTTTYIGQAVFESRPPWKSVIRDTWRLAPRLFWTLGIVRGAIPGMVLVLIGYGEPLSPGIDIFLMSLLVLYAMAIRSFRPFLPEILLLEQCPIWTRKENLSASKRSSLLHGPIGGDLLGRFILTSVLNILLAVSLFYAMEWSLSTLFMSQSWSLLVTWVLLPSALWLVAGFSVVMRFLSYLDSRIRLEGWEVELLLRAEKQRQFGDNRPGMIAPIEQGEAA